MPFELSAPPFASQQHPHAPKIERPAVDIGDTGSVAGSFLSYAPPSVAGSAIIPGQNRAIGSPHRAIPALSAAGRTPASLHVPSVTGSAMSNPYGLEGSYRPTPRSPRPPVPSSIVMPNKASTMIQTGGWMPAAALPAPRRAPASVAPRVPRATPSSIAPVCHRHLSPDDDVSDAGYYSRRRAYSQSKKSHGSHKASSVASSYTEKSSSKEDQADHRKHERHRSPSRHEGSVYSHSPAARSPLAQASVPRRIPGSSLLSPHHKHGATLAPPSTKIPIDKAKRDESRHHHSHSHRAQPSPILLSARAHFPRPPKPIAPSSVHIPNSPYRNIPIPPSVAFSVGSSNAPGAAGFPASMYQAPSIVGVPGWQAEVFEGGHSVVGSQLTFLDGAIGGKTSCYGLPKYPREMKPDYRRFCVQRGNADVYLD